ncbi:DUF4157 domain-containing protein [Streptomyces sp. NPDC091279]|uniref:eCIS core domain-containing protein n=1 Tax=Streptomyces sp. NPDC091279 TaxID=3365983 RepID=UPI00381C8B8C
MRRSTESRRNTEGEQSRPRGAVRATGPLPAGSPGALQGAIGNAAVSRMIARERNQGDAVPPPRGDAVREAARTAGRGGKRLPTGMRTSMESAFGTGLGHIRVSVDEQAAASIDAKAYTVGDHIVVQNAGVLRDVETMAHEIHHTTQRDAPGGLSDPDGTWEREAADVGARVARGQSVHRCGADGEQHGDGGDAGAIQRRVGFEFESQWQVRDHNNLTDEDEQNHQREIAERDAVIDAKILWKMADRRQVNDLRDAAEQDPSAGDLVAKWLTPLPGGDPDQFQLTAEGSARIARAKRENPDSYRRHAADAVPALLHNNRIRETPLPGRDVPKMGTLGSGTDYRLTSDVSPTGGSALEWVTDPLTTKDQLLQVMGEITALSTALDNRKDQGSFLLDEVNLGSFTALPGMMIFPLRGALLYAPQMTGGFKLAELPRLVEYLDVPAKAPGLFGRSAHERRQEAKQDLHRDSVAPIEGIRQRAEDQAKGLPPGVVGGESTDGLVGLITLIGSYLSYGSNLEVNPNSKSIAGGLMSRTSFAHNFTLLSHPMRMYFREDPNRFVAFALKATGLPENGTDLLYNKPVAHGDAGHRDTRQIPLTRAEWLKGIPVGKDLLRNYKHLTEAEKYQVSDRRQDWEHIHGSLGALGSVDDKVGRSGKEEVALVAELRRMRDRIPTADLQPLALAAFDLVQRLNEGKSLDYKKK